MGLTLVTPKLNETLKIRQDELLRNSFLKSLFLKNAFSKNYSIISEDDIKNLSSLLDGNPVSIMYHEKSKTPLIKTPIGVHILKLGFYTLLMTNTSNEDLISVMTNKEVNKTWTSTQGFVLPTKLVDGLTQRDFIVSRNVADKDIKTLQSDPYNILGESISLIERKLKNISKPAKTDIGIVLPRNRNLLQVWNYAFMDLNTVKDASTLKFNYKENMKFSDYFPYLQQFLGFIYKHNVDAFNQVVTDILELKYIDVKYMNIADRTQRQRAEQTRKTKVQQTLSLTEIDSILDEPIELIQASTKTTRTASLYEHILTSVPSISLSNALQYKSFSLLNNEFKNIKENINTQIGIIQQDMTKNYVNCQDIGNRAKEYPVFGDTNSMNLCKKYNEVALGNNGVKKIHSETAKAFGDVIQMVLKSQKRILTYSYEFILDYRKDSRNFPATVQQVVTGDEPVENVTIG
jgi:muconolactone delta-isomerase